MLSRYVRQPLLVGGRKLDLAAAPPAPARGCSYYWLHRMPKDESEYALLVDTLEEHGFRRAATPEQVAAAALLWCGTSTIRAPLLPMYEALQLHARIRAADNETIIFCWRAWWYGTAVRAAAASSTPAAARCGRAGRWCCGAAPSSTARRGATAAPHRRQRDHHLLRAAGAGGAGGRRRAQRVERRIKKEKAFNTRLDLLLFGPGQGRSGCGAAALWCTTHAGFAPCSPTFRVPLGTSHANSADVFTDLFGRTVRHGRSRKRRSERGRHHAKGTR